MRQVTGRRLRKETVCIRRQQVVSMVRKAGCRLLAGCNFLVLKTAAD